MALANDSILNPALTDAFLQAKVDTFRSINCVKVGVITKFNVSAKTAEVQILFKRVLPDGSVKSYPLLVDCPVVTLQGGGAAIQFPIAAGDQCLLLFSDRSLDVWFKNGAEAAPADSRCHDLSDGIALVGMNALNSALEDYKTDEADFSYLGAVVGLKGGKVTIHNGTSSLITLIEGLIDVLKALTDANNIGLSAASIAALEAQKALFQALLRP